MKEERINELLGRVERVGPPPFLLTRIEGRIASQREQRPAKSMVFALGMVTMLLVVVNIMAIVGTTPGSGTSDPIGQLVGGMQLSTNHQLYHD